MMLSSPAFGLTGCRMGRAKRNPSRAVTGNGMLGFASLYPSYFVLQKITSPPQSPPMPSAATSAGCGSLFPARCGWRWRPQTRTLAGVHESWRSMAGKNIAVTTNNYISRSKPRTSLTTVAARFAMIPLSRGSRTGFLASVLFLAVAAGATIVKADEGAEMPAVGGACGGQLESSGAAWHRSQLSTSASLD
jgi:hypothetical protein